MNSFLLLQDGASHLLLQDSSGALLLQSSGAASVADMVFNTALPAIRFD